MSSQRMSFNFQDSFTAVELLVSLIGLGFLSAGLLTTEQMKIISSTILFKLPFDNVSPTDIEGPSLYIGLLRTCSKINSNASKICTPRSLVYPIYNISALSHANLNMTGGPIRYIRPPSLYPRLFIVISISFLFIFAFINLVTCLRRLRYLKFMRHRWMAGIHNMLGLLSALISLPIFAYLYLHFLKIRLDFNDRLTLDDPPVYLYAVAGISNQLLWSGAAIFVPSITLSLFHKRTAIVDSAAVRKRSRRMRRSPRTSAPSQTPAPSRTPHPPLKVSPPRAIGHASSHHEQETRNQEVYNPPAVPREERREVIATLDNRRFVGTKEMENDPNTDVVTSSTTTRYRPESIVSTESWDHGCKLPDEPYEPEDVRIKEHAENMKEWGKLPLVE